jgi:hypothetical protein
VDRGHLLSKYRRFLPTGADIGDEEFEKLHDQLSVMARAICKMYSNRRRLFEENDRLSKDERASTEERAAILEFDGRLSRKRAEAIALADAKALLS